MLGTPVAGCQNALLKRLAERCSGRAGIMLGMQQENGLMGLQSWLVHNHWLMRQARWTGVAWI